jgi:3-dehydrosphinganine reductase
MRFLPPIGEIMDFDNKNIFISGGSSGIGLALAKKFSKQGANITILARRESLLKSAIKEIENSAKSENQRFQYISANVCDFEELNSKLSKENTDFNYLFNCAGIAYPGEFIDIDPLIFKNTIEINYLGTVYLTKLLVPRMIAQKSGHIINFSSYVALVGYYGYTAYAPSKYAIEGFSRTLRPELKPYGIDVSVVIPQDTDTPQLVFERARQPFVTKHTNEIVEKIFGSSALISADQAAEYIFHGIEKKKFLIYFGTAGLITSYLTPLIDKILFRYTSNLKKKML